METALVNILKTTSPTPVPVTLGSGSDAISLSVSEDSYRGLNAKVVFSVDGQSIGIGTISALHNAGQSQVITLDGNWGLGTHIVTATLQNPASNHGIGAERAAYVTPISYDGAAQSATGVTLTSTSAQNLTLVSATIYSPGATGGSLTTLGNDTVLMGTGAETIDATGPSVSIAGGTGALTFLGHAGMDSITAGAGSIYITPGTGSLTMNVGGGSTTVTAGMGQEVFTVVNGSAGGDLTISGFVPGKDVVHLVGFSGTGIQSQSIGHSSSQFTLTDNTTIIVGGLRNIGPGSVFG